MQILYNDFYPELTTKHSRSIKVRLSDYGRISHDTDFYSNLPYKFEEENTSIQNTDLCQNLNFIILRRQDYFTESEH
jgi:hypothetical protein